MMIDLHSKGFNLIWGTWTLLLGVSLFFIHTIHHVHSFSEYLRAFVVFDLPASWCPTFLALYGVATLAAHLMDDVRLGRIFNYAAHFSGLILLPIGISATYIFTLAEPWFQLHLCLRADTPHLRGLDWNPDDCHRTINPSTIQHQMETNRIPNVFVCLNML